MRTLDSRRGLLHRWLIISCLTLSVGLALTTSAMAAEPAAPSLKLVPQDASFYSSMLRLREQYDAFVNSKFWENIQATDQYSQAMMMWQFAMMEEGNPMAQIEAAMQDPENAKLGGVFKDMISNEVFLYGGKDFVDAVEVLQDVSNATNQASYRQMALMQAGDYEAVMNDQHATTRAVLEALDTNIDKLQSPEFMIGFRVEDEQAAAEQLQRLEAFAKVYIEAAPEAAMLRGKLKRKRIADSDFLTLTLDGDMIPWDTFPLDEIGDAPEQFDALKKHVRGQEVVVSLGVHKGYVLLSFGPTTGHVEKLGTGPVLADAERLAPLRAMGDKRFTGISFASEAIMKSLSWTERDLDNLAGMAAAMLPAAGLDVNLQQDLQAEVAELKKDIVPMLPQPGDSLSFSFLNGRGYELFAYDWGKNRSIDASKPLPVLQHLGGSPILAIAGRGVQQPESYDLLVKWLKRGRDIFEAHVLDTLGENDQAAYAQISSVAYPALQQADQINRELLLPSLADGQGALVIDGVSTSAQWHMELPSFEREMPMPLPAIVMGLSDADKFKQALGDYKSLAADTLVKLRELAPEDVPPVQIPDADEEMVGEDLTIYSYPLPPVFGFNEKVAPNLGISEDFAVMGLVPEQTKRLAQAQPLTLKSGPLADISRPLGVVVYLDFHAAINTAQPWIEEAVREWAMQMAELEAQFAEEEEELEESEEAVGEAMKQVDLWISLARVLHSFSSATYAEGEATVTHAELHIEDVK